MTTLDDYWPPPAVDDMALERESKVCRHPRYARIRTPLGVRCEPCGHVFDDAVIRRGRSARRLGGDQERRIEKVYGPVKIGERGDAVDHIGRVWRWQSKATRTLPARWLATIDTPTPRPAIPAALMAAHAGMAGLYGGRRSVVIRSFVSRGIRTRDWLFVHASDAYQEFRIPDGGYVIPWSVKDPGYYVIPGDWWLDHFGRDE